MFTVILLLIISTSQLFHGVLCWNYTFVGCFNDTEENIRDDGRTVALPDRALNGASERREQQGMTIDICVDYCHNLGVESDYTFIKASHELVNLSEAKDVCNKNNLTLPTFNESTLLQFATRTKDFIGTDLWQDDICGWKETTCQGDLQHNGEVNVTNVRVADRNSTKDDCLRYHINSQNKVTCDFGLNISYIVCQKYDNTFFVDKTTDNKRPQSSVGTTALSTGTAWDTGTTSTIMQNVTATMSPSVSNPSTLTQTTQRNSQSTTSSPVTKHTTPGATSTRWTSVFETTTIEMTQTNPVPTRTKNFWSNHTASTTTTTGITSASVQPTTSVKLSSTHGVTSETNSQSTDQMTTAGKSLSSTTPGQEITTAAVSLDTRSTIVMNASSPPTYTSSSVPSTDRSPSTSVKPTTLKIAKSTTVTPASTTNNALISPTSTSALSNATTHYITSVNNITDSTTAANSTTPQSASGGSDQKGDKSKESQEDNQTITVVGAIGGVLGAISLAVVIAIIVVVMRKRNQSAQRKKVNMIMARRNPLYTPHQGLNTNNYASPLYDIDDPDDNGYNQPKQGRMSRNSTNIYSLAGAIETGDINMVENQLYSKSFH